MLIVVTGPAYSGRMTMAKAILKHIPSSTYAVPVLTTCVDPCIAKETVLSTVVTTETFLEHRRNGDFLAYSHIARNRYGILESDIKKGCGVLACDPASATLVAEACIPSIPTVCVYMHCSIRTMLFRRAAESRVISDGDLDVVMDVYSDHSLIYSQIVDAQGSTGFDLVIPVNSDRMCERAYVPDVVQPLAQRLQTLEKKYAD